MKKIIPTGRGDVTSHEEVAMQIKTRNANSGLSTAAVVLHTLGRTAAILVACLSLLVAAPASAEEEKEKKPIALGSAKKSKKAKGLAGYAAQLKLKKSDSNTISNSTLSGGSGGGTLSQGGGVTTGVKPKPKSSQVVNPEGAPGEETKEESWTNNYDEQKKKIEDLEKRSKDFDAKTEERKDPYINNPYNRNPGTLSWEDQQRQEQQKALDEERKKLDDMRRKARREGVDLPRK